MHRTKLLNEAMFRLKKWSNIHGKGKVLKPVFKSVSSRSDEASSSDFCVTQQYINNHNTGKRPKKIRTPKNKKPPQNFNSETACFAYLAK